MTQTAQPNVIIYTRPDCTFSGAAKLDLRRRRVAYTEFDLTEQPDKLPDLLALTEGERVTPVIVENGKVTIGFKGQY